MKKFEIDLNELSKNEIKKIFNALSWHTGLQKELIECLKTDDENYYKRLIEELER